jgi:hypothetical protein
LPNDFKLISATSDLKIIYKDNHYFTILNPGRHFLTFESFTDINVDKINIQNLVSETDSEIWSIQNNPKIRQFNITGASQIDSKQVKIPQNWKNIPSWYVQKELSLTTESQGISLNSPLNFQVNKKSWYGFNDDKIYSLDQIETNNNNNRELTFSKNNDFSIQSVNLNNQYQLILEKNKSPIVVIPQGDLKIQILTESSVKKEIPLKILDGNYIVNQWKLNLAPRFRLVFASNSSAEPNNYRYNVSNYWITNWNLYSVFSLFVLLISLHKLMGKYVAIVGFLSFLFFSQFSSIFWSAWLLIVLNHSFIKYIPEKYSSFKSSSRILALLSVYLLIVFTVDFTFKEIQSINHYSLDYLSNDLSSFYTIMFLSLIFPLMLIVKKILNNNKPTRHYQKTTSILFLIFILWLGWIAYNDSTSTMFGSSAKNTYVNAPASAPNAISDKIETNQGLEEDSSQAALAGGSISKSITNSPGMKKEMIKEIKSNFVNEKIQVGRSIPQWNYDNVINLKVKNNNSSTLWIASPWLVNLTGVFQIILLLLLIFHLVIYNFINYNKNEWFQKIPKKFLNNPITNDFIKHSQGDSNE